ncbi:11287_t:CDS:1 [Gigaspora rosea]|nr:11287_t:CDS:1 [Gigaspora rosea]
MSFVYCDIIIPAHKSNDAKSTENISSSQLAPLSFHHDSLPNFKLPFPPIINASEFLAKTKRSSRGGTLRSPNAFLIYRKAFLDHLVSQSNCNFKMTDISKLVSVHWNSEADYVKLAYKKIAQDVEKELIKNRKKDLSTTRVIWKDFKTSVRRHNKQNNKKSSREKFKVTKNSNDPFIMVNHLDDHDFIPENVVYSLPLDESTNCTWTMHEDLIPSPNSTPCNSIIPSPNSTPCNSIIPSPNSIHCNSFIPSPNSTPCSSILPSPNSTPCSSILPSPNSTPCSSIFITPEIQTQPLIEVSSQEIDCNYDYCDYSYMFNSEFSYLVPDNNLLNNFY